jgi:FtsH-binding integral membrane protein
MNYWERQDKLEEKGSFMNRSYWIMILGLLCCFLASVLFER